MIFSMKAGPYTLARGEGVVLVISVEILYFILAGILRLILRARVASSPESLAIIFRRPG
jgi:hypothetical protein